MSVTPEGTQCFVIDPDAPTEVITIKCVTNFSPGSGTVNQHDNTCLEETEAEQSLPGLVAPGQASITVRIDPGSPSHKALIDLSQRRPRPKLVWALGWPDGTDVPTALDGAFTFPSARTYTQIRGHISNEIHPEFSVGTAVEAEVQIQRSGGISWSYKAVTP